MNMFKRGRKAKDQGDPFDGFPGPNGPATTFRSAKITKHKGKHIMKPEEPAFSLATALPPPKDLRTSLMMPSFMAQFDFLKEDSDGDSELPKTKDDSYLYPKRASRMNLFAHNPMALGDIAEADTESISSSFKPPFARRKNSFGDGYDSDSGSMMTRPRPGEGNNLFGGRQKLYRIATGSTKNLNENESPSVGGKHMYESDVSLSLFQQYRRQRDQSTEDADDSDAVHSPTLGHGFSQKRGTQSSTASAASNLRSSTAATSVASESPCLQPGTLASHPTDMRPSPSPTLRKRRDEPQRPTRELSHSKSAVNMRERYRPAGIYAATGLRGLSPASAGAVPPLDFGFGEPKSGRQTASPSQSEHPNTDDVLASNVSANDRGKATALGLFNKPAREFDEQQYLQRQLQMHEGRNSPFQSSSRSQSRTSSEAHRTNGTGRRATPSPAPSDVTHALPQLPRLPPLPTSPQRNEPASKASNSPSTSPGRHTPPPRSRSKSSASATAKDNVKARVESLIRRQNAELAQLESEKLGVNPLREAASPQREQSQTGSTFFDEDMDDDSTSSGQQSGARQSATDSLRLPESEIHPAFRSSFATSTTSSQFSKTRSVAEDNKDDGDTSRKPFLSIDSDTGSPDTALGLSGMIRSHLRHDSERSVAPTATLRALNHPEPDAIHDKSFLSPGQITPAPPTPTTAMSQRAQMMLSQAQALQASSWNKPLPEPDDEASDYGDDDNDPQDEKFSSHQRGDSSATTKERREFDEELAKRRTKIREGLKSVVERDQPESPPASAKGREYTLQAFASSEDKIASKQKNQPQQSAGSGSETFPRPSRDRSQNVSAKTSAEYSDQRSFSSEGGRNGSTTPSQHQDSSLNYASRDDKGSRSTTPSSKFGRGRSNSAAADRARNTVAQRDPASPPVPSPYSPPHIRSPVERQFRSGSPYESRGRSGSSSGTRSHVTSPTQLSEVNVSRPLPISSSGPFIDHNASSQQQYVHDRATAGTTGRSASQGGRKRSDTKTEISGPVFISSTSSVPLIPLPQTYGGQSPPPLPEMNPRRRGNNTSDMHLAMLNLNLSNALRLPLETVPASPRLSDQDTQSNPDSSLMARPRPKLRKSSSEGGNLASTARQQAVLAELQREKAFSPGVPNRSATTIGLSQEGGMF